VLLGRRDGPARLEPLDPPAFQREFRAGAIREESWGDVPPGVAEHWSRIGAYRLTGAADLAAAVDLVAHLAGHHA
jgi:hypothetical protein